MIGDTSRTESCSTHDGACTACRARKIKCGREKPQCGSCIKDKAECSYSPPPKRVNYVKVLCQNVDDIQGRLVAMQGELLSLTEALKNGAMTEKPECRVTPSKSRSSSFLGPLSVPPGHGSLEPSFAASGHVIRDSTTQVERYYGPWTLVALCRDFGEKLASCMTIDESGDANSLVEDMLTSMMTEMIHNTSSLDHQRRLEEPMATNWSKQIDTPCCLPPRQLLAMTLEGFLKNANYNTDVFSHKTISDAVERVYSKPQSDPSSETWAVCFNLIILLMLGAENPLLSDDPFVRPLLQAVQAAAQKRTLFTVPSLVGIQALALLSLLMQQNYPDESLGDYAFVQACTLARQAGLHRHSYDAPRPHLAADETAERLKVFRSLYTRDRYSAMLRGSPTWLPGGMPTLGKQMQECKAFTAHWQLAYLQDDILHRMATIEGAGETDALLGLLQRLETWGKPHISFSFAEPISVDELSLHLAFLGTRMRVTSSLASLGGNSSNGASPTDEVLRDARLASLLLVKSCGVRLSEPFEDLARSLVQENLHGKETAKAVTDNPVSTTMPSPDSSHAGSTNLDQRHHNEDTNAFSPPMSSSSQSSSSPKYLPPHHLVSVFPSATPFVLARYILDLSPNTPITVPQTSRPSGLLSKGKGEETNPDIALLQALHACFRIGLEPTQATHQIPRPSQRWQLCRVIEHLLRIIKCIKQGPEEDIIDSFIPADEAETYEPMSFETNPPLVPPLPMEGLTLYHQASQPTWITAHYNRGHQESNAYSGTSTPLQSSSYTFSSSSLPTPPPLVFTNTPGDFTGFMNTKDDSPDAFLWWNGDGSGHNGATNGQTVQSQVIEVGLQSDRQMRKRARVDQTDV